MTVEELKKLVIEDNLSNETEQVLKKITGSRGEGELTGSEEKLVREVLKVEVELADIKAELFENLVEAADRFVGEVGEKVSPDVNSLLEEFVAREDRKAEDFKNYMLARIDLFASEEI